MPKNKFGFCLVFVLVVGLCANLLASDEDVPLRHKLKWLENSPLLQKEARTPFPASGGIFEPPDLRTSQKTQNFTKAVNGTGAISGHVYQASRGVPIEGVKITADQLTCPSYSSSDYSDENGYYLIDGLPPGNYMVSTVNDSDFVNMNWDNKPIWETPDTVEVFADDTTEDINFSLRVGGKITGTVTLTGAYTNVMVTISATDTASRDVYSGSADYLTGSYVIKRLPTATYKAKTSNYLGYIDAYYNDKSDWASADPISVTEGATASSKDFTLSLGGSIEGNISSTVKGPLEDILVWGYYASYPDEWSSFGFTDENGDYMLTGLRSGYWKVMAYGDTTYAFEWYANKNNWTDADSVLVTAPGTVSDKDFALEVGGSISGHVYSSEKGPLSGCDVIAYQSSFYQWGTLTSAFWAKWDTTSADGSYQITGLRTGDYYVMALTECHWIWYNNHTNPEDADTVHVTMPGERPNINFNLPTAVETEDEIARRPAEFELHQNYPNPFNPGTKIEYTLKKTGHVTLHIYNVLGEKVKTLLDQDQPAGLYEINWDGKNDKGQSVSSGLYLYKLEVNGFSEAKRMLLLK